MPFHDRERYTEVAEPGSIGTGYFCDIYNQFKGKIKDSISFLLSKKGGVAKGA